MPNNESALLVHRENYIVPKGEERAVHYKIAKMNEDGGFIEKPRIVKTGVKLFETSSKRNLELAGYVVEILYHPNGTYSNVKIVDKNLELAKKDAEIMALKAELEAIKAKETKAEEPKEEATEVEKETKKVGRPPKNKEA